MNRTEVKRKIKRDMKGNVGKAFKATLAIPIFFLVTYGENIITGLQKTYLQFIYGTELSLASNVLLMLSSVLSFFVVATSFNGIKYAREELFFDELSFRNNFTWIDSFKDLLDYIGLAIVLAYFTFLWSLLFLLPGIYKTFAYSQSVYVFFENKKRGTPVTYRQALKISAQLMKGNKLEYITIFLSFLGYLFLFPIIVVAIAVVFVFGRQLGYSVVANGIDLTLVLVTLILMWWLTIYQSFTLTTFYVHLTEEMGLEV